MTTPPLSSTVRANSSTLALVAISPGDLVNLQGVGLNFRVLALTVVVSLLTGLLFGLAILPFTASLSLAAYLDLRARAERFDLETLEAEAL